MQRQAAEARLPFGARWDVPEALDQRPALAAVGAVEERCRRHAAPQLAVGDAGHDHPDPLHRRLGLGREGRSLDLLPAGAGIVAHEEMRPELAGGDAGEIAPRPGIAHGVLRHLAGEGARGHLDGAAALAAQDHEALLWAFGCRLLKLNHTVKRLMSVRAPVKGGGAIKCPRETP
jgi:hypothetical protein